MKWMLLFVNADIIEWCRQVGNHFNLLAFFASYLHARYILHLEEPIVRVAKSNLTLLHQADQESSL